jgi:hypothetical protein
MAGSVTLVMVPTTRIPRLTTAEAMATLIASALRARVARPRGCIHAAAAQHTAIVHQPGSYGPPETHVPCATLIR